jgi:hypothetical protein
MNVPAHARADLFACLLTAGLLALVYAGGTGPVRMLMTLGFVFFVPGRAIITNWPLMSRWSGGAMSMVLSLAILTTLATVTLWAHGWRPMELFQAEAWLSMAGLAIGIARRARHGEAPDGC